MDFKSLNNFNNFNKVNGFNIVNNANHVNTVNNVNNVNSVNNANNVNNVYNVYNYKFRGPQSHPIWKILEGLAPNCGFESTGSDDKMQGRKCKVRNIKIEAKASAKALREQTFQVNGP